MENPNFLKKKYNLHRAPETESAANRTEKRTGDKVPQNPDARIQNYLDRFKEIIERKDPEDREMGMQALKKVLHNKFVINPEEIPDGYFENQRRIAREQGHGDIEITNEIRRQHSEVIIADQESSLDKWIDYLSSEDATYPDWLKYYAVRSVLGMSTYDKEKKAFAKRTKETVAPFPDLNREALAYVLDVIEKKQAGVKTIPPIDIETDEKEYEKFEKLLQGENFAKLYAWAIEKVTPDSKDLLTNTKGEWIKYDQGSDHMPLVQSLQGHGTGWCTAGESTAQTPLQGGDFYVYYSYDEKGKPTIPRAAIRQENGKIAEVRGIAHEQNIDPYIGDVVNVKLTEFTDGEQYEKKVSDMKQLTEIEKKVKTGKELDKNELIFLYEVISDIEGFGYDRDPRIEELRFQGDLKKDISIILDLSPDEIACKQEELSEKTKFWLGKLFPGIFEKGIEYIYTSFPEGKIQKYNIEIGGKTKDQLREEIEAKNIFITSWANDLLKSKDFIVSKDIKRVDLVCLTVKDLGFSNDATTAEIYQRGKELGLELCSAEVGPHLRLQYLGEEYMLIAMQQIADSSGDLDVFCLLWQEDRPEFYATNADSEGEWDQQYKFVFHLRKKET